jgi:hypothetical protein
MHYFENPELKRCQAARPDFFRGACRSRFDSVCNTPSTSANGQRQLFKLVHYQKKSCFTNSFF